MGRDEKLEECRVCRVCGKRAVCIKVVIFSDQVSLVCSGQPGILLSRERLEYPVRHGEVGYG